MINWSMIARALGCVLALTGVAYAADPARPDLKLGLWELTHTGKYSGQAVPAVPDDVLRNLPPDLRRDLSEKLAEAAKPPDMTFTIKTCITPAKLSQFFAQVPMLRDALAQACQMRTVSSSASEVVTTGTCSLGPQGTVSMEAHTKVVSPEAYTVTTTGVTSIGAQTVHGETEIKARWLGSNCGDVKE